MTNNQSGSEANKKNTNKNYTQNLKQHLQESQQRSSQYYRQIAGHIRAQKQKVKRVADKHLQKQKLIYRKSAHQYVQEQQQNLEIPVDGQIQRGSRIYTAHCDKCHMLEISGQFSNKSGPSLGLIHNRKIGSEVQFTGYSDGMLKSNQFWTTTNLYKFMKNPVDFMPGTTCSFSDYQAKTLGLQQQQDRADLLTFLKEYSKQLSKNVMLREVKQKSYDIKQTQFYSSQKQKQQQQRYDRL